MLEELCCVLSRKNNKQIKNNVEVGHLRRSCYICPGTRYLEPDLKTIEDGGVITRETLGPWAWLHIGWESMVSHRWLYIQSFNTGTFSRFQNPGPGRPSSRSQSLSSQPPGREESLVQGFGQRHWLGSWLAAEDPKTETFYGLILWISVSSGSRALGRCRHVNNRTMVIINLL